MTGESTWVLAFLLGLGLGFVNSVPIGPITVSIVDTTFRRGFPSGMSIGLGALTVDVAYCIVGVFGMAAVEQTFTQWMKPLSVPILGALSGRLIYEGFKSSDLHLQPAVPSGTAANFSKGFFILLANPLAMGFWLVTAGTLLAWGWIGDNLVDKLVFILGMTIGTFLWFFLLARVIHHKRQQLGHAQIRRVSIGAGFLIAVFAVILAFRMFTDA